MRNASKFNLRLSVISVGVIALFSISSAMADDEELKALTQPKSSVQVEAITVDSASAKFGEYNGLNRQGAYANGGVNIRGGSAYTKNENGDTTRWSVTGDNLGLTSRSANASIADQGSWGFGVNFDQLQHNISDSYQTPYQGKMGGNSFTLPSNMQNTYTNYAGALNLGKMEISSTRYNTTVNGSAIVDPTLNFTFEYNNLIQSGAKLQGFGGATNPGGTNNSGNGSKVSILPNPTDYTTDTLNLAANWRSDSAHLTASYFGSFFKDNNNGVNWQVWNGTSGQTVTPVQTMSTMPSNALNQINLAGGYDFSNKTKLTGNLSASQNTQNQGFGGSYDTGMVSGVLPQASMNGLVNTTHADLKLTDQSIKDLTLTAAAKFDQRDNLSQSNVYKFYALNTDLGTIPNTPMSFKQNQLLLSGDYRITKDQKVGLALANNAVNRWCNQYGSPGSSYIATNNIPNNTTNNSYYLSPNCVNATSSNENKADLTYKIKASESVDVKLAAGYANRKTDWDQSVIAAMPYRTEIMYPGVTQPPPGYNAANVLGFQPFFEASRKQFSAKGNTTWQVDEKLAFTLGGKYTNDIYPNSTYGVQNANSWSLNFDGNYQYSESGSFVGYVTQQNQQRSLTNANTQYSTTTGALVSNTTWNNTLATTATTFGLGVKQGDLVDGKLTLMADGTVSLANSIYSTPTVNYGGLSTVCNAATTQTCGILPGIKNNMAAIKLGGSYQIDKNSKVGLMYWYQHLYSNDFYYNGYQTGTAAVSGILPTNQSSPSYNVNVISANYTYTFD